MSAIFFQDFLATLRDGESGRMGAHLDAPDAAIRMSVYRNTALRGQIDALAEAYPTVVAALGEGRFHSLALAYCAAHPLTGRSLSLYGEYLPAFIATHAGDVETRVVGDLARLDRAWLEAYTAADAAPQLLQQHNSARLDATLVGLHPSVRLARLSFDAFELWDSLRHARAPAPTAIADAPSFAVFWRPEHEVFFRALPPAEFAFLQSVANGASLGAAASQALSEGPFDPAGAIAGMASVGVFAGPVLSLEFALS
jgi:hypothetical protein